MTKHCEDLQKYAQYLSNKLDIELPKEIDDLSLSFWISENDPSHQIDESEIFDEKQ